MEYIVCQLSCLIRFSAELINRTIPVTLLIQMISKELNFNTIKKRQVV